MTGDLWPKLTGREREAYLTLALVPGVGPERLRVLRQACGSWDGALRAPFGFLSGVPGISRACATAVAGARPASAAAAVRGAERQGGTVVLPGDPDFPAALLTIQDPPTLLFAKGCAEVLAPPAVAIVGARRHTRYGRDVCARIAGAAATAGLVVVSGMARGLDAVAHRAALEAGGTSIGILGNGLGVVYPAANRTLYDTMADRGLLLTEFAPGERPTAGSFQRRNRLISGLARVTVVVEAGGQSGTLITARTALDQGRDVLAVPGPVSSPVSVGTNRLIRDGAIPLLELGDLLERYPEATARGRANDGTDRSPPQAAVLEALRAGPLQVDQLAAVLGAGAAETLSLLAAMEIQDLVRQEPGMVFRAAELTFAAGR